jgi:hypothetical protein
VERGTGFGLTGAPFGRLNPTVEQGRMRLVGATVCVLLLAAAPSMAAKRIPVAFHGLRALGLLAEDEASFARAIRDAIAGAPRLSLTWSGEVTAGCKHDIACHCRAARKHRATRALFGNVGRIGRLYTFELVYVDAQSCTVENTAFLSETHDVTSARARLGALVAQLTTPREQVTETVVKNERDVAMVPATVTVFTAKQLRQLGITSFEELFRLVPGFEVIDQNFATTVLHHGLPGTILYVLDGVPLSTPMFTFRDLSKDFLLSFNDVERIELVRGPGSVLWGPNAFLGIVNIVTRMPTEAAPRLTAQATYGTLSTGDFHASVEQSLRYFRYSLATTVSFTKGPQTLVRDSLYGDYLNISNPMLEYGSLVWGNGGTTSNDFDHYYDVTFKLEVIRRLKFVFSQISHEDNYQISPFGSLLAPGQGGLWKKSHRIYSLAWDDRLPRGFRYRVSASRYESMFWENYAVHPARAGVVDKGSRYLQGNDVEPQVNHLVEGRVYHSFERGILASQALLGVTYLHQRTPDTYADVVGITELPAKPTLDQEAHSFHHVAGFFQEDLSLWGKLLVSGGLRWEHRDPYSWVVNTQAALIANLPTFNGKVIYAEGFRPPEANMLFSQVGVIGNPDLRPERSRALSVEAGTRLGPVGLKAGASATWLTDEILLRDAGAASIPYNVGWKTIYATFGEISFDWQPYISAFVSYDYKHLSESDPLNFGTAVSPHAVRGGLSLRPFNDLSIYATFSVFSSRDVLVLLPGQAPALQRTGVTADLGLGVWVTNLFDHVDIGLKARNPFGFTHLSPSATSGNPNLLLEERRVTEVLFTLRWSSTVELGDLLRKGHAPASRPAR